MAPKKFGLFKGRSREHQEQPSTENLLKSNSSGAEFVLPSPSLPSPPSPMPSTSRGYQNDHTYPDYATMNIDNSDDEDEFEAIGISRRIALAKADEARMNYRALPSTSGTSTTTLQDLQDLEFQSQHEQIQKFELATPDDATSLDVNSIQFDATSIVSEDVRYCGAGAAKKPKKNKPRLNQDLTDEEMWHVTNTQVMEEAVSSCGHNNGLLKKKRRKLYRLLERNCTINELIKWEAIALARGICTLTTNCVCRDCNPGLPPQAVTDGDAGIASAPFLSAVSIGCELQ